MAPDPVLEACLLEVTGQVAASNHGEQETGYPAENEHEQAANE
jgi:hypothetical protein